MRLHPQNNGKIEQIKVSGRTTYFCPTCQKEK
ncbi:zinc finger domain-containing protein [Salegentibacter salegens]|nr:zinc finger domain-containing protein [Salegentibacter salegens]